ncbi:FtsX-like permease family protein [Cellulomonas sp. JZ18]|uniref:FtsX-like permease family protein n=1 Tax=Cellulomonas sp. JZ18 TaxID=2654191 RepID=UPI0012D4B41C|nr:ABC transporter permease [Cellulomonas sp. JZ18]QGQ19425.1 FtsX-like permease family protein [Cellulomonas sp. JZ18]
MTAVGHLALRSVRVHAGRLALTVLAVALAVAVVAGSLALTGTSERLLDAQFRTAAAGVDVTVRGAAAFDSAMGVEVDREPLPAALVDEVRAAPGVEEVQPVAEGSGLLEVDGSAVVPTGASVLSSYAPAPFGAFGLREGRAPVSTGEVAVDAATARAAGLAVGDTVDVLTDGRTTLRVVGLVGFAGDDGVPGATVALVPLADAQRMLGLGDGLTELQVRARAGTRVADVVADLRARLGDDYAVASAQDGAAASAAAAAEQLGPLRLVLTAMAAAALLVGTVLVATTFTVVVGQRRRELALLRAAGATAGQVTRLVLAEALVVGAVGSAAGTLLGLLVADGLRVLARAAGNDLPEGRLVLTPSAVLLSVLVGLGATALAAAGTARRAARVAPVEALRAAVDVVAPPGHGRRRTAARLVPLVAGTAGVLAVAAGAPVVLLAPAVVATVVGVVLNAARVAPALTRVLGAPLAWAGVPGRLARESAARAPRRTTSTAIALALGLALVAFTTVAAASLRDGLSGAYRETITADLVVESARGEMLGGLSPAVVERLRSVPEVAVASRVRYGHVVDGAATTAVAAVDPRTLPAVADLDLVDGSLAALADGGVVVAESVAAERGLRVGDVVVLTLSHGGPQDFVVVGVVDSLDAQALSTAWFVSLDTYAQHFTEDVDASVLVRAADGVTAAQARTAVGAALRDHPTAAVRDQAAAAHARGASVEQVLGLVHVLLGLVVVIALLGVTSTLALSVAERVREIGLLRAVGTTTAQVGRMVRAEAVLVAGLAAVLGLALGIGSASVTVSAVLGRDTPLAVALPAGPLAVVVLAAVGVGLVAGLAPARRAARTDVLTALAAD